MRTSSVAPGTGVRFAVLLQTIRQSGDMKAYHTFHHRWRGKLSNRSNLTLNSAEPVKGYDIRRIMEAK